MIKLTLIAILIFLSGCIIPYFGDPEPYQTEAISSIEPGITREDTIKLIGKPDISRNQGDIWLYGRPRSTAIIISMYGVSETTDFQYLLLQFKKDQLHHIEVIEKFQGCSTTGICITWDAYELKQGKTTLSEKTIVSSKGPLDIVAKRFTSTSNNCSVYIYTPNSSVYSLLTEVDIGPVENVLLDRKSYINTALEPGKYLISTRSKHYPYRQDKPLQKSIDCNPSELLFLKIKYSKWNPFNVQITDITIESPAEAKQTIKYKTLLFLP